MAGSEATGPAAARADLFQKATTVLTPTPNSDPITVEKIRATWVDVGCRVLEMSAEQHDELVARSSHLPHIVASALAGYVLDSSHVDDQRALCASGFKDTTRVASGSPEMWKDIVIANRINLSRMLDDLIVEFESIRSALQKGDEKVVYDFFQMAKQRRDDLCRSTSK